MPGNEGKPLGVCGSWGEVVEVFFADGTELLDGFDDVAIAAVILVKKEYERR